MPKRLSRVGEVICRCDAYKFPHRLIGGRCNGYDFVEKLWETTYGSGVCSDCGNLTTREGYTQCEVVHGGEKPRHCPQLSEYLDYEEVPVPLKYERTSWS